MARRSYRLRGKYATRGTCSCGKPGRRLQLWDSFPSQGREPPDSGWVTWVHKVGSSRLYTHTVSSTPIAAAANTNSESARERGGDSICTWVGQRQATASQDNERLWLFGEGLCVENQTVTVLQWVCPKRLFKRGAEMCWAGTLWAAALPEKGKIESVIGCHWIQLARQIRKVHKNGISHLQPHAASGPEAAQSGEFGTVSAARAVGWELDGQKLSTWDYLQPGRAPYPRQQWSNLHEGKDSLSTHFLEDHKHHPTVSNEKFCITGRAGSITHCRVHIHKRKTERETPKGPFLTSLRETKYTHS